MRESEIGPYRILERLGQGGMGEVYLAEDPRLGRRVAVKTIAATALDLPDARERLLREARAAAGLNHPNIAAIYDIVEGGDSMHVVMELVEGENLAARLLRGPLPPDVVAVIGIQLASALAAAHAQGIVHRDLKPANVQLTVSGSVKVLDFGLAKRGLASTLVALDASPAKVDLALTEPGQILGTPAYMAPEQLRGHPADQRSDIYSLGVVLFELLTGRKPYEAPDFVGLALVALTGPAAHARSTNPGVPEGLSQIVGRAMERRPDQRYQSAAALQADLERFAAHSADSPTRSVLGARTEPMRGVAGRRRSRVALLSLLGVAILGAVVAGTSGLRPRTMALSPIPAASGSLVVPVVAVLPLANASGDPANDHLGIGMSDALVSDLAGLSAVSVVFPSPLGGPRSPVNASLARELGAAFLVTGSVQRTGDLLKVSVKLLRQDESVAWGYNYEGSVAEVFDLQRQLAQGVSQALQLSLSDADRQRLLSRPTSDPDAFAHYSQARLLLERPDVPGNVERASSLFQAALDKDARFALAHAGLGDALWQSYQKSRDPLAADAARRSILEALRLDPAHPGIRIALGVLLGRTGRAREAVEELSRAAQLRPDSDEAHRYLAEALARDGKLEAAIAEGHTAIRLRPSFWQNHRSLGFILFEAGRHAEALPPLQRATELQPDSVWGFQMLGATLQAQGRTDEALVQYRRANALAPNAMTLSNIGMLHHSRGEFREAVEAYRRSLDLQPNLAATHRNLGDALVRLGQGRDSQAEYNRAIALLRNELQVAPDDPARLARLASYEAKAGQSAQARRRAAAAIALRPDDPNVLYHAAVAYALSGRSQEAAVLLERALARGYSATLAKEDEDLAAVRKVVALR